MMWICWISEIKRIRETYNLEVYTSRGEAIALNAVI